MATACTSELFVGLAVLVNDWDALNHKPVDTPPDDSLLNDNSIEMAEVAIPSVEETLDSGWVTDLEGFIEDVWTQVASSVKKKLREACVDVLRRTDTPQEDQVANHTTDEAHLLD